MDSELSDGALSLSSAATRRRSGRLARWLAARVQERIETVGVRLQLWDGFSPYAAAVAPIGDIVVHDLRALAGIAFNPDLYFGEAYMAGRLDVRGGMDRVLEALSRSRSLARSWKSELAAALALPNTLNRSRRNVHHHYDLGNDFYQLWLDEDLAYTCAYYARPDMSLEDAQRAKFDLVCRKLQLQPGETVVEAGCGWGGLALHMARHYGVHVTAFNVSREQLALARGRARDEGLSDRVDFVDDDYRNIAGTYDAFVSVGMLEHVGLRQFQSLADVIRRTLRRENGRGLLHFIGRDVPRPLNPWIRRRIFPGGYPPTIGEVARRILVPAGMSILDVENLRLHYAQTLAEWHRRFCAHEDTVLARYGSAFKRAWELYLAGSRAAFTTGWMQLFQVVFAPHETAPPYWTRTAVYDKPETHASV